MVGAAAQCRRPHEWFGPSARPAAPLPGPTGWTPVPRVPPPPSPQPCPTHVSLQKWQPKWTRVEEGGCHAPHAPRQLASVTCGSHTTTRHLLFTYCVPLVNTNTPGPPSRWLLRTQSQWQVAFNHTSSEATRAAPNGGGPLTGVSRTTRQRSAPHSFALHERHGPLSAVRRRCVLPTAVSRQRRYTTSGSGRVSPSHLSSRAEGTWSSAVQCRARQRPAAALPLLLGAAARRTLPRRQDTMAPSPHSRSASREVAAPPLPRPRAAGGCAGSWEGRGRSPAGCGTNLEPFPPTPAARCEASVAARKER